MDWYKILFLCVYGALLISYMVIKAVHAKKRIRGPVKMLLAAMFTAAGVYGAIVTGAGALGIVLVGALTAAATGDFFLIFMQKRVNFHRGVVAFGISNILLITYAILHFGLVWWSALIFAVIYLGNLICQKLKFFEYGKSKIYLNVYLVLVGFSGSLGLSLAISGAGNIESLFFGLGAFMFLISDICLGLFHFKFKYWPIDVINSVTYFGGLILIATSIML